MRTPEFNAYIAPARLYPQIWRLILGILLILFIYLGFMGLVFWAGFIVTFPMGSLRWANAVLTVQGAVPTLIMLFTFTGMALGPIIAAPACHMRGPGTLFGPLDVTLRGFLTAAVLALTGFAIYGAVSLLFQPVVPNLAVKVWLQYLPYALPVLLIQTSAEELLFRGYLQQQLAVRFRSRAVWMLIPAALFSVGHYDAEMGDTAWLVVGVTFVFALIAADLVERTGSLGAAIGLHFANNVFALLLVSVKGTITGLVWRILRIALDR